MVPASDIVDHLKSKGLGPFIGVPCSYLQPLISCLTDSLTGDYIAANNEGEAIALATGAFLSGRRPVVMFQNSGLGNAVNPLTSLTHLFGIPLLIFTTLRGDPRWGDEPQHQMMGRITERMLDLMDIPHAAFPETIGEIAEAIGTAVRHLETNGSPYAFIVHKGTLSSDGVRSAAKTGVSQSSIEASACGLILRREALEIVVTTAEAGTLIVATTGKTARELYTLGDRPENFYVVGSMGCASSIALGVAMYQPSRAVVALDGDGAALMRLEAMASIGHYAPCNLLHLILDNESYESTGGQSTMSPSVDFPGLALACGYRSAVTSESAPELAELVVRAQNTTGPHLVHFSVRTGSDPHLKRPLIGPPEVAVRFREMASSSVQAAHSNG